jgi:citrate synthase
MNQKSLADYEDIIITKMGKAFLGERVVYRGEDLHVDLRNMNWLELYAFGITGKKFSSSEVKMLNFMWISTSYPDKSIWPNHIAALSASSRSTPILGISAGLSVFEASLYAGRPLKICIDFLLRARQQQKVGVELSDFLNNELARHDTIYGYGRPLHSKDERVFHVVNFAKECGLSGGEHLKIAEQIASLMKKERNVDMNIVAIYAAVAADLGFTPEQFHLFMTPAAFAGMPPCYIEAMENPAGSFLPIRCDRIAYTGPKIRSWD